jgi:hypothetical protein
VKSKAAALVGVPANVAVAAVNVRPAGSVPVTLHVTAPLAPLCVKVCENDEPTLIVGNVAGFTVMVWQAGVTVKLRVPVHPVAVCVAVMVNVAGALLVGVPLMTPLVSESPAGKAPLVTAKV